MITDCKPVRDYSISFTTFSKFRYISLSCLSEISWKFSHFRVCSLTIHNRVFFLHNKLARLNDFTLILSNNHCSRYVRRTVYITYSTPINLTYNDIIESKS